MKSQILITTLNWALIIFGEVYGKCSFEVSDQQTCNSLVNLASSKILTNYKDFSEMAEFIYTLMGANLVSVGDNDHSTGKYLQAQEPPSSCEEISDDQLWDWMNIRREKNRRRLEELDTKRDELQTEYEDMGRRNSLQLLSLQQTQNKYRACNTLRRQLLKNITKVSAYALDLRQKYNMVSADLNTLSFNFSNTERQYKACEQKFFETRTILSQMLGPSPIEDYYIQTANVDVEDVDQLNVKLTNFMERLGEKQKVVDDLVLTLKRQQSVNAALQAQLEQQHEASSVDSNCSTELRMLKDRLNDIASDSSTPNFCLNQLHADFCSLEVTDATHNETCWFERTVPADYNWRVVSARRTNRGRKSPLTDHTCSSPHGRFLLVDLSRLMNGQQAKLTTYAIHSDTKQCFSFWYNIGYTFNYGNFYALVLMKSKSSFSNRLQVWRQNLVTQEVWQFSSFEIPSHVSKDGYRIQLVAESNGPGYIAVDDLSLVSGPCPR